MEEESAKAGDWLESLQTLAKELKAIPSGAALHNQLQQLLEDWQSSRAEVDHRFSILLSFFLGTVAEKGFSVDITLLAAQLIAAHSANFHYTTPDTKPSHSSTPHHTGSANEDRLAELIETMRQQNEPAAVVNTDAEVQQSETEETESSSTENESGGAETELEAADKKEPIYPEVERRVNSAYRMHLDRKHGEIDKLQEVLAQKAAEAITQNKEFGALLEIERSALQQASSITEIENMKEILIGGTEELIAGQRNLTEKLHSSFEYLQLIESDSERLHDELNKVRLLSLTDEYTGLPNRRAFIRRLDDEIARVQRYNTPLSVVLIDLDNFKAVNDQYGHPAGDAVLAWYAQNVLPTFRHYDMVARYGGEEFAVLFPSTTEDGAERALNKIRKRITNAVCEYEGADISVPTFSAGLTIYRAGDTQSTLIKRADKALYHAKSLGRDRVEMELPTPVEGNSTGSL